MFEWSDAGLRVAWYVWVSVGLLLALAEIFTGNLVLLLVGLAAASAAVPSFLGLGLTATLTWFGLAALAFLFGLRPRLLLRMASAGRVETNTAALSGRTGAIHIEDGHAWVRLDGDLWRVEESAANFVEGEMVVIDRVEGNRLRVRRGPTPGGRE